MAVDYEARVNFDRLREERKRRAVEQLRRYGLGAVIVFDFNNIRYITGTHLGEWARDKMARFAILTADGETALFDPAAPAKRKYCPWIADRVYPIVGTLRGALPPELGSERVADIIKDALTKLKALDQPIGVDVIETGLLKALERRGLRIVDGQEALLDARIIKTRDEIELLNIAASMVDAVYSELMSFLRPGVRENEVVAFVNKMLYELGSDHVECVNVVTGPRGAPHPHMFSDRIIRPGDMIYIDIMHSYNGYRTCYYRTFVAGEPTRSQVEAYEKAWEWLKKSIDTVKPGATTADVASCWPSAQEIGFKDEDEAFLLEYGHGIGLSIWEKPIISRAVSFKNPVLIQQNMVFALETWCPSRDGTGAARIEVEVVVTETGREVITKFPADRLISVPVRS
ncbi:MAG: Xaa-Pro peptidase family protein [Desulfurococcaceae archaeon]